MSSISTSTFVFRDFLKYILPTILAGCLFAPLSIADPAQVSIESIVFMAAILGYAVYTPVAIIANAVHRLIPFLKIRIKKHANPSSRWDFNKLWLILDKDEREYLYLTHSYFEMYQALGFYLLLFAVIISFNIVQGSAISTEHFIRYILSDHTTILGGLRIPTIFAISASLILSGCLYYNASVEYDILHGDNGFYDDLANKYQKQVGGIARSIWGYVKDTNGLAIKGVDVLLINEDHEHIGRTQTNADGYFQFLDMFTACQGKLCLLRTEGVSSVETPIKVVEKSYPCYTLTIQPPADTPNPHPLQTPFIRRLIKNG